MFCPQNIQKQNRLPISILYLHNAVICWPLFVLSFSIITNIIPWEIENFRFFILISFTETSDSMPLNAYLFCYQSAFLSSYPLKVVSASTSCAISSKCQAKAWAYMLHHSIFILQVLVFVSLWVSFVITTQVCIFHCIKFSAFLVVLSIAFCTVCTSNVLTQITPACILFYWFILS